MNIFSSSGKPNAVIILHKFIKELNLPVNAQTIEKELEEHPEFPSLLSISDCLTSWNIPNEAQMIDKADYEEIEFVFPFIAHAKTDGGQFFLVKKIDKGFVYYCDTEKDNASITEADFLKQWDGVLLYAAPDAQSGEPGYAENRVKYTLQNLIAPAGLVLLLVIIYAVVAPLGWSWGYLLLGLVKLLGLGVSILLLVHTVNSNNPFVKNLCGLAGKNDCNAILKSDASKVTSWLSWTEVGFFYFAGSALLLLLDSSNIALLGWLNLLALPYTVYSIVYQYRHKNWCVLCCLVQGLLWLEFALFLQIWPYDLAIVPDLLIPVAFLSPVIIWALLKPVFLKAAQSKPLQQQLNKFKYNTELFQQTLTNQPRYAIKDDLMPIMLGNVNAEHTITMVTNPYCSPCAKVHDTLEAWLKNSDNFRLKIIFTTANRIDDPRTKVASHLMALGGLSDANNVEQALNDWYKRGVNKFESWAEQYPVEMTADVTEAMGKQNTWCNLAEITFTPTILINGYKLPEAYNLADVKYFIS